MVAVGLAAADELNEVARAVGTDSQDFWGIGVIVDHPFEYEQVVGVGDLLDRISVLER